MCCVFFFSTFAIPPPSSPPPFKVDLRTTRLGIQEVILIKGSVSILIDGPWLHAFLFITCHPPISLPSRVLTAPNCACMEPLTDTDCLAIHEETQNPKYSYQLETHAIDASEIQQAESQSCLQNPLGWIFFYLVMFQRAVCWVEWVFTLHSPYANVLV